MDFFDDPNNVDKYLTIADGYDGAALIAVMAGLVSPGGRVLELGMGPGKDLALLTQAGFDVVGSDRSAEFLARYDGPLPTLQLDAVTLETDETFDIIYSNKVLHHLTAPDFATSLERQVACLRPGGVLFHSLWLGDGEADFGGVHCTYHTEDRVRAVLPEGFTLAASGRYEEMAPEDSFWVLLQRQG